jgi:phenylalanyl-tRNA synthetase alpha chain
VEDKINDIRAQLGLDLGEITDSKSIENLKIKYLGKKGLIQSLMRSLKDASPQERPQLGKTINTLKETVTLQLEQSFNTCLEKEESNRLSKETIDVTLPGRRSFLGRKHPLTQILDRVLGILADMGFSIQYSPEVENDYYNFESLNFPPDHPARDMQDTFFIQDDLLLRTHTSNTQVRVMESQTPPIRVAAPGKCFRNEEITARSHVVFHQVEGFYVDKNVTFADLFATLEEFFQRVFNQKLPLRMRPSYFPFVEPGLEVDVSCLLCKGKGCNVCKHTGWLEVAGAGMIHPEVLKHSGIDPEVYSGYAWGLGPARLLFILNGINDIRLFFDNDMRFLEQFA